MKKNNMMIVVAAAAMLAACSDTIKLNNDLPEVKSTEKIGFAVYSEKATRADQNSNNLYDFYKTFDVYAWKTVDTVSQVVFSHEPVEYFVADTCGQYVYADARPSKEWGDDWQTDTRFKGWFYENVRYWDKLANSYNFYAIAPYEVNPTPAIHIQNGQGNIKIGEDTVRYKVSAEKNLAIVNDTSLTNERKYFGFDKDYMLATSGTKNNLVSLTFSHILTKLNVMITLTDAYKGAQPFTIKEMNVVGLEDDGYYDYDSTLTKYRWFINSDSTYNIENNKSYVLKNVPAGANDTIEYSGYYWIQTLIFPQTLTCDTVGALTTAPNSKYLYVEYTIGNETFKSYYDLAYVFGCTQENDKKTYNLEQGSEYTINIKVGPEPIVFDAKSSKWADDTEIDHSVK